MTDAKYFPVVGHRYIGVCRPEALPCSSMLWLEVQGKKTKDWTFQVLLLCQRLVRHAVWIRKPEQFSDKATDGS
ncbi:hypothetical protein L208DRAFT_1406057 [Tricholoma matsutake]|nr:hypothetical protein L208DRAFT_1406057 [Tricholoma matsutake 945]